MDREKVIKGLEVCFDSSKECNGCPYITVPYCRTTLRNNIVALLKEQEAVEPIKMQRMDDNFSFFVPHYLCGNCRYELVGEDVMFCSHFGRSVKWE